MFDLEFEELIYIYIYTGKFYLKFDAQEVYEIYKIFKKILIDNLMQIDLILYCILSSFIRSGQTVI